MPVRSNTARSRPLRFFLAFVATLALIGATPNVAVAAVESQTALTAIGTQPTVASRQMQSAADLSQFRPGNIISNAVFYDSTTMSEAQIDAFLRARVPNCQSGYVCLKDFRQDTTTRAADAYCDRYDGATGESAARIIQKVAAACGINPQVILVTLQKEQGLVTHTWPSDWRYTIAMGQGCPDTAACDTRYYGFYNQVYGAARQFKLYGQSTYFTWYKPGKTWNVLFNPNQSCGSSPVYIENQATANLYYYTPYQPNAAALRAGYGEGDGCSSYGNRNFYNYFSDWFGSLQTRYAPIVKSASSPAMYFVTEGVKHYIPDEATLRVLMSALPTVSTVPDAYLASVPAGRDASRYVHDARSGALYLLESDGTKHWFSSGDLIARFGYSFGDYVNLSPSHIDAFRTGDAVGDYFKAEGSADYYVWRENQKRYVVDEWAWAELTGSRPTYVATMKPASAAGIPLGRPVIASGILAKEQSTPNVYLTGTAAELVYVDSFDTARDAGVTRYRIYPDGTLSGFTKSNVTLGPVLTCGGSVFALAGTGIVPVNGAVPSAAAPALPESVCAVLPRRGNAVSTPFFVKNPAADPVLLYAEGTLRHVRDQQTLQRLNAGRPLVFLSWSAASIARVPSGAPYLTDGSFVQFGDPDVFYANGGVLRLVPDVETLTRLASPRWPVVERLPESFRASYTFGPAMPR